MPIGLLTTFTLDMVPGGPPPIIHASAGDVGRRFRARILFNGEAYELSEVADIDLVWTKPDGTGDTYGLNFDEDGNVVDFVTMSTMTDVPGRVVCEFRLSKGSGTSKNVIGSANFILEVEEPAHIATS